MTALQEEISAERLAKLVGTVHRTLVETDAGDYLEARLPDNAVVRVKADPALIGRYAYVKITAAKSYILEGDIIDQED